MVDTYKKNALNLTNMKTSIAVNRRENGPATVSISIEDLPLSEVDTMLANLPEWLSTQIKEHYLLDVPKKNTKERLAAKMFVDKIVHKGL